MNQSTFDILADDIAIQNLPKEAVSASGFAASLAV
jgi:hypothetical protein